MHHIVNVYGRGDDQVDSTSGQALEERRMLDQREVIAHLKLVHPGWSVDQVFAHIDRMNPDLLKD
jgi:hypothetical protein